LVQRQSAQQGSCSADETSAIRHADSIFPQRKFDLAVPKPFLLKFLLSLHRYRIQNAVVAY